MAAPEETGQPPSVRRLLVQHSWLVAFLVLVLLAALFMRLNDKLAYTGTVVAVLAVIAALRLLPPRYSMYNPLAAFSREQLRAELVPLLGWALLYPLLLVPVCLWMLVQRLPLFPEWTTYYLLSWNYFLAGKLLLLFLPVAYLVIRYGGNGVQLGVRGIAHWSGWIVPLGFTVVYLLIRAAGVYGLSIGAGVLLPFQLILVLWALAFFAAGWTEEYLYRVLLQTRLEIMIGRWNGWAVATLLFGIFHLPSRYIFEWLHQTGTGSLIEFVLALSAIVLQQTIVGGIFGYAWMRFRNAWALVLLHTGIDALGFMYLLISGRLSMQ